MAIVKFISDFQCNIFVDLEYVGVAQADKMLKVSLEPGSYLIEAIDEKGKSLKKYALNVSPTESQVLQNLHFYDNTSLTNLNVEESHKKKTLVKRIFPDGEKATVIDSEGNNCLGQWFFFIGSNDETILLKNDKTYYVLSTEDYLVKNIYYDAKYDGKADLIPVYKEIGIDDMYGFIDKSGSEVIPFIYDYVWNFEEIGFAKVKRFGCIHAVGLDGTLYYNIDSAKKDGKEIYHEPLPFDDVDDAGWTEVFEALKLSKEESINKGFEIGIFTPIKEGNHWGLAATAYDDYEISQYLCDRLFICDEDNHCFAYRKDGFCTIEYYEEKYIFEADEVIANFRTVFEGYAGHDETSINNVIIRKNKKYGIADLSGKILLPVEYDLIEPTDAVQGNVTGNIGIVWKDGFCTFVWMATGEILEPFKYENIIVNKANGSTWLMYSTYLVKENGKYGCIDFERKPILPSIYDTIEFKLEIDIYGYHYKMLLFKDGKVGAYEYCNYRSDYNNYNVLELVFSIEPEYDECVFLRNKNAVTNFAGMSYLAVRRDDKWGIIDNKPVGLYYYYDFDDRWRNNPNLKELDFKYNSLEELKDDADNEFERRHDKYVNRHRFDW